MKKNDPVMTMYYSVAIFFGDRVEKLRTRGSERGAMTTTEIAVWTLAALALATTAFFVIKGFVTKQTGNINNTPSVQ